MTHLITDLMTRLFVGQPRLHRVCQLHEDEEHWDKEHDDEEREGEVHEDEARIKIKQNEEEGEPPQVVGVAEDEEGGGTGPRLHLWVLRFQILGKSFFSSNKPECFCS